MEEFHSADDDPNEDLAEASWRGLLTELDEEGVVEGREESSSGTQPSFLPPRVRRLSTTASSQSDPWAGEDSPL